MTQAGVNCQRIGVLGGTFDPIHIGHLVTGVNVRHQLALDVVFFVVANDPWQKADRDVSPAHDRLEMVEAAISGHPGLEASAVEIEHGGASHTADTLVTLGARHPGAELFLIVGTDQAANLDTWERPEEIRRLATLVVVGRPGTEAGVAVDVEVPALEVSSSDLRARFAGGRPVDWLVPDAVAEIARDRRLYTGHTGPHPDEG